MRKNRKRHERSRSPIHRNREIDRNNLNFQNSNRRQNENPLSMEETKELLEKLENDDYHNGSITMELTKSKNRFLNFLKYTNNNKIYDSNNNTVKLILKVVLKASKEHAYNTIYANLLKDMMKTVFCEKLIDKLINIEIFNSIIIDWELINLLIKFFIINLQIIKTLTHEHFEARIYNFIDRLERPFFQITNDITKDLLKDLKILNNNTSTFNNKRRKLNDDYAKLPTDNFRSLSILPHFDDLKVHTNSVYLRINKIDGIYKSVDDYLDVQFRLMREDFIQPLREGLRNYKMNHNKKPSDIRIYTDVKLVKTLPSNNNGIICQLKFNIEKLKKINWYQTKRFIYGSFLCLSNDNFETNLLFATVSERDINDLRKGMIYVKFFDNIKPNKDLEYVCIESINMYESYRHVLKRLQSLNENNLCLKDYLVYNKLDVSKPSYLINDEYNNNHIYLFNSFGLYPCNDSFIWPHPNDLNMDHFQFKAFKNALTKEISLIQGPPGTGKTYVGLNICKCLLDNLVVELPDFGPILIVCYTNHALDQFLEGIALFTDKIVRVGSRSKSKILEKYSLKNLRNQFRDNGNSSRYNSVKYKLNKLKDEIITIQHFIKLTYYKLIQFDDLQIFMNNNHKGYLSKFKLIDWLSGEDQIIKTNRQLNEIIEYLIEKEYKSQLKSIVTEAYHEVKDDIINLNDGDLEINYLNNQRRLDNDDDVGDVGESLKDLTTYLNNSKTKMNLPQFYDNELFRYYLNNTKYMTIEEANNYNDLSILSIDKRWDLYRLWRHLLLQKINENLIKLEDDYEEKSNELIEINFDDDRSIMSKQNIIGMTTTGAARYGDILEMIRCKIIIVEEAAEVLESHIIGSLNHACQHLILIGDHKQLKPNPSVYNLSIKYNLDLSLFERLINKKLKYVTLQIQHRMRPEISQLMTHIYDNIMNHESVLDYPNIPGMRNNLYFLSHTENEKITDDIISYSNIFEASFVIKLCRHLIKNGINNENITILTLYTGQMFEIRKLMKNNKLYDDIRICVVDNYQGEENDIIILSLVRSNNDGKIGFLKIENRVCVSLSRAKHGLYIFGNANMFNNEKDAPLWKKVCLDLRDRNLLGKSLHIKCEIHSTKILKPIEKPNDFDLYSEGGCDNICNERLNCGHSCKKLCHLLDRSHKNYKCIEKCTKLCEKCNNNCYKKCYENCGLCYKQVKKIIPNCNHEQLMRCSLEPQSEMCDNKCNRALNCGHLCIKLCKENCYPCKVQTKKLCVNCNTEELYDCSLNEADIKCKRKCNEKLDCGHICNGTCGSCFNGRLHCLCNEKCQRILICNHACKTKCNKECPPCMEKCDNCCIHNSCLKKCGEACIECMEPCNWSCKHYKCTKLCSELCDRVICNERCSNKRVKCNKCQTVFPCYGVCGEICRKICKKCDDTGMLDIFFGEEDKEDALFITLNNCGHSFELNGMDYYMNMVNDDGEITKKCCPKCKTIINLKSCFRYGNIIKKIFHDVKMIQLKLYRSPNSLPNYENYKKHNSNIKDIFNFYNINNYLRKLFDKNIEDVSYFQSKNRSLSLDYIVLVYEKLYKEHKMINNTYDGYDYIKKCIVIIINWLNPINRKFSKFEIDQFYDEIERVKLLIYIMKILTNPSNINEKYIGGIEDIFNELKMEKYVRDKDKKVYYDEIKSKIKKLMKLPNMDITEFERRQIVSAINLGSGRWFKCSNGHFYVIGECGGANQVARCPECNDKIGGSDHVLISNNQLAPEMDGAVRPAYEPFNFQDYMD